VSPKIHIFWDVTTCRLAYNWRRFEGPRRLVTPKEKSLHSFETSLTIYRSTRSSVQEYLGSSRLCLPDCEVSEGPAAYTFRTNFCAEDWVRKYIRNVILFIPDCTMAMLDGCKLNYKYLTKAIPLCSNKSV